MINLLLTLIFNSFWIFGFNYCTLGPEGTQSGEIFYPFRQFVDKYIKSKNIKKPIMDCVMCMSSIHGVLIFSIFYHTNWIYLPFYCIALAGLNRTLINKTGF